MDGQGLRMCRFTRDGIPELGEYLESVDGTGICKLTELDGGGEEAGERLFRHLFPHWG